MSGKASEPERPNREEIGRIRAVHAYRWLWEPLEEDPTFVLRPMFGTKAVYLGGKLVLCFSDRKEPWHGVLVATEREFQEALMRDFPGTAPHPILPKWLYLPDAATEFESTAERLVEAARRRDGRIGVVSGRKR